MEVSDMQISGSRPSNTGKPVFKHAVWQLAFRSFFLAGGLFAAISIGIWALLLTGKIHLSQQVLPGLFWHAHEMIFGFAALIAVGFILTAVQTWTGKPSISGLPLVLLLLGWLSIRFLLFAATPVAAQFAFVLTLGWWLMVVATYARLVVSTRNTRNYLFVPLLSMLGLLNLSALALAIISKPEAAVHIARSAVLLFTMIMAVVGGRVIPFFTVRGANTAPQVPIRWLEKALLPVSVTGITVFIAGGVIDLPVTPAPLMMLAGTLHLVRMTRWSGPKTLHIPLLWSLHVSYAFMGLGLFLLGLSYHFALIPFSSALHLVTIGAIGLMIISMMSRVSLGHTGRPLEVKPLNVVAFALLIVAALVRFFLPMLGHPVAAWVVSASLWIASFTFFFFTYWPVLTKPRHA